MASTWISEPSDDLPNESAAKPKRRKNPELEKNDDTKDKDIDEEAPAKSRSAGWGFGEADESTMEQVSKQGRKRNVDLDANQPKTRNNHFNDDDTTDIMTIRDLDEQLEDDITTQIADAPRNLNRKIQSLKELDQDVKFSLPTATLQGLDLSILAKALCPQVDIQEPNVVWEFDTLLQEVAQEIQKGIDQRTPVKEDDNEE